MEKRSTSKLPHNPRLKCAAWIRRLQNFSYFPLGEIIMGEEKKLSSDALQWAYNEFVNDDPESVALLEEYEAKADIGQQVFDLRTQAGMTQAQLAELVGIAESVIHDLEEADCQGDSLAMLVRIGSALNKKVEVRFVAGTSNEADRVSEFQ